MNERIQQLRAYLNLTLEKFGNRIGVTKTTISRLEKGINNVTEQMVKSICREFNVNEEWLRYGTGEMFNIPVEVAALMSSILDNPDDYQFIIDLAKVYAELSPELRKFLSDLVQSLTQNLRRNTLK